MTDSTTERPGGASALDKNDKTGKAGKHGAGDPVDALPATGGTDSHQTMDPGAGHSASSGGTMARLADAGFFRIMGASLALGLGRYALEKASQYARERTVWSAPIGTHQGDRKSVV